MERSTDLPLNNLKRIRSLELQKKIVDLEWYRRLTIEIQRAERTGQNVRFVDPVTQAFQDTVHNLHRGRDRTGRPLFYTIHTPPDPGELINKRREKGMDGPPYEHLLQ